MSSVNGRYNVGGILLPRPFKIRRLGHFGFNVEKLPEGREFYGDLLGFKASDTLDFSRAPWFPKDADLGDPRGYFMRYGTDHHAFVLFPKKVMDHRADRKFAPEVTINQITWQCGSLKEIVDAHTYFEKQQVRIQRVGRDMPGSNWHVYVYDPDGHTNEFYYGIEQIGWNQASKPRDMYYRGFQEKPTLPQMSETAELAEAEEKGVEVFSGHRPRETLPATYDVEGVLLPRPFKITKVGPVSLFVDDVERAEAFYTERLGFVRSEETAYRGARSVFLRCGAEHHSMGLFPKELRRALGLSEHTTCMSFGVEVGSYAHDPARAISRHRLLCFRARSRRTLHPALLLYGADRLGWPSSACGRAAPGGPAMARGAGAALRHLCRPGLPGPAGMIVIRPSGLKDWALVDQNRAMLPYLACGERVGVRGVFTTSQSPVGGSLPLTRSALRAASDLSPQAGRGDWVRINPFAHAFAAAQRGRGDRDDT
jgi:catechol 2,3-dioxygenase-like lactoylglutathione lyase family enzyme